MKQFLLLCAISTFLLVGCSKKNDAATEDSMSMSTPGMMDSNTMGAKDSGLNNPAGPQGMTGGATDSLIDSIGNQPKTK